MSFPVHAYHCLHLYMYFDQDMLHLLLRFLRQGESGGRVGFFPSTYVMRIKSGERAKQIASGVEVTEVSSNAPVKLHKDQVRAFVLHWSSDDVMAVSRGSSLNVCNAGVSFATMGVSTCFRHSYPWNQCKRVGKFLSLMLRSRRKIWDLGPYAWNILHVWVHLHSKFDIDISVDISNFWLNSLWKSLY